MSAVERVKTALHMLQESDRPEVWIAVRERDDLLAEAERVDAAPAGPLSGKVIAVKDNIDVAGLPTTAGCPAYSYRPAADAPAVGRLRAAGAVVLGKTNLDQFATGLVGTRSPYGAVRDARRPDYISGGSSSGSAVAVALGIVDAALGTDTAGSGRVPAAFQGVIGLKPTRGLVSTSGVVPACRTLDCVSIFAPTVQLAETVLWTMAATDPAAPSRQWDRTAPLSAAAAPVIGVPGDEQLAALSPDARATFARAIDRFRDLGASVEEFDLSPFLAAGELLYNGAFVAERYAAVGEFIAEHLLDVDPTVSQIIDSARTIAATAMVDDQEKLEHLARRAQAEMHGTDALLLPTVPRQPTLAEVASDPVGVNAELGRFTTFANLLDLSVISVPAGEADGGYFGVSLIAPACRDRLLGDLVSRFLGEPSYEPPAGSPRGVPVLVVGAHRHGQPLNHELTNLGARFQRVALTAPDYKLYALNTVPPKPGLVRSDASSGTTIEGELWELPKDNLGRFLEGLPWPMTLGAATLEDGKAVVGFGCQPSALTGAEDISAYGSWLRYLEAGTRQ